MTPSRFRFVLALALLLLWEAIAAQVRDPQSVRYWPQGKMPSFSKEQLSDEDLMLLLEYLRHMAGRKARN